MANRKKVLKRFIKKVINYSGYELNKKYRQGSKMTMADALYRCRNRGIRINTVIDVGASNGCWSKLCMNYFPKADYLLIEANPDHELSLKDFVSQYNNSDYVLKAAGKNRGEIFFNNVSLTGGGVSTTALKNNCIIVPETTIDSEIMQRKLFKPPYLIKLDTHGYEIPILEGAQRILENTSLLVIEAYNYKINKESIKYFQLADYLDKLGFYSIEIVDLELEKKHDTLWQMDIFFIKSDKFNLL